MSTRDPWDLKQLRDDVQAMYGSDRRRLLERSLGSLDKRLEFARYHYQEQKKLMAGVVPADAGPMHHVELALGGRGASGHAFGQARMHAMAHVVACVASMHAVADTLAYAVYHALAMDLDPRTRVIERSINVHSVLERLECVGASSPMRELTDHDGFRYLNAMANQSKHQALVGVGYRADFDPAPDAPSHGLSFAAFEHKGAYYEQRWVAPTLNAEYDRQQPLIQAIGRSLNSSVATARRSKAAKPNDLTQP